jgi:hypothetical protein
MQLLDDERMKVPADDNPCTCNTDCPQKKPDLLAAPCKGIEQLLQYHPYKCEWHFSASRSTLFANKDLSY